MVVKFVPNRDLGQVNTLKRPNRASAVGRLVVRFGLPAYNPATVALVSARHWRQLHSS